MYAQLYTYTKTYVGAERHKGALILPHTHVHTHIHIYTSTYTYKHAHSFTHK